MAIVPFRSLLLILAMLLGGAGGARAESITADSVWDEGNARQRALQQVPAGAVVKTTKCETISVGLGNTRYRCTVTYGPAPLETGPAPVETGPAPAGN